MDHQQTSAMGEFLVGSSCEVMMLEEGFLGSWYRAEIVGAPYPDRFRVRFSKLRDDKEPWLSLQEIVPRDRIRPVHPTITRRAFYPGLKVEVRENGGWWEGRIVKFISGRDMYEVEFDWYANRCYAKEDIRLHLSLQNGKYVNNSPRGQIRIA